ncbi:hypothetical protein SAY86_029292 [Trapa natans]|uniref:Uncharacterized protein n=1 Tax=Trapa natans TaxID=22666 RepID=A0AAN7RFR6_TRANT|nr:hypothetical protein SAY86_029292 [Trapa natans]
MGCHSSRGWTLEAKNGREKDGGGAQDGGGSCARTRQGKMCSGSRGLTRTSSGDTFRLVIPIASSISTASSPGVTTSNAWTREPSARPVTWRANEIPGHILRPLPKGMSSKFCPLTSMPFWVVRNLSGWNSDAIGQTRGSRWIL